MSLTEIKKELKKLEKDELINLIADLYKKNKSVKEFLDFYVNPNKRELFEKYSDQVFDAFYPKRGYTYNLKDGKKAISDFKKFMPSSGLLAELMLFYIETGVKFTTDFGDIDEAFYSSLEKTYDSALTLMSKENLLGKFADRAGMIAINTCDMGWGFHDNLSEVYYSFYPDSDF